MRSHKRAPTGSRTAVSDTVDANLELGLPVDSREYGIGARVLSDLGVTTVRLMTNNPAKRGGLEALALDVVDLVPIEAAPNPDNIRYLLTTRERMGHLLRGLNEVDLSPGGNVSACSDSSSPKGPSSGPR